MADSTGDFRQKTVDFPSTVASTATVLRSGG
jgi:hypothetical protein